jgi:hypothetical protein
MVETPNYIKIDILLEGLIKHNNYSILKYNRYFLYIKNKK